MATTNMRIVIRRDTSANWVANGTVVLLLGEQGYETDTRMMKVGDGTTQYKDLPYFAGGITGVDEVTIDTDAFGNLMLVDTVVGDVGDGSIKDYVDAKDSVLGAAIAQETADRIAGDAAEAERVNQLIATDMWLYASTSVFPDAATNHGRVVHSHADGAMFYAHAGAWHRLEKADDASMERDSITARLDAHEDSIGALDNRVLGNTVALNIARDSIIALDDEISALALVSAQADTALDNKIIALDARVDTVETAIDSLSAADDSLAADIAELAAVDAAQTVRLDTISAVTLDAYQTEGDAAGAPDPLFTGDVYYNVGFGKGVVMNGKAIPGVKSDADAVDLEAYYSTDSNSVKVKGVYTIGEVDSVVAGLEDSISTNASDISNTNSVLGAQINTLGARLDTVEPAVDSIGGIDSRVVTLETGLPSLQTRVTNCEDSIGVADNNITNLEASIELDDANKGRFFRALFTPSGGGNPPFYADDLTAGSVTGPDSVAVGDVYIRSSTSLDDGVLAVRLT